MRAPAVLVGISIDAVGLGRLPQLLAAAGCEVTVACGTGLSVTASRHVTRHVATGRSPMEVRLGLEAQVVENPDRYGWVLIADEPLLRTFVCIPAGAAVARLAPVVADPEKLHRMLSKVAFNCDAELAGIAVPPFRVLREPADLAGERWEGVPFVLKAEESLSGSGVRVVRSEGDLAAAQAEFKLFPVLRQEYEAGRVGGTMVLFGSGVPLCWFSYFLCRNWPHAFAASSALEIFWHPQIEPMLEKLGRMTQFDGLCGLDWVLDGSGQPLLLEINPRPVPGAYVSKLTGVSFPQGVAAWLAGKPIVQRPAEGAQGFYRLFPQNLFRAIDDRDPVEFVRTWAHAPWSDPQLLLSQVRRVVTHYLPQSWRDRWKRRPGGV